MAKNWLFKRIIDDKSPIRSLTAQDFNLYDYNKFRTDVIEKINTDICKEDTGIVSVLKNARIAQLINNIKEHESLYIDDVNDQLTSTEKEQVLTKWKQRDKDAGARQYLNTIVDKSKAGFEQRVYDESNDVIEIMEVSGRKTERTSTASIMELPLKTNTAGHTSVKRFDLAKLLQSEPRTASMHFTPTPSSMDNPITLDDEAVNNPITLSDEDDAPKKKSGSVPTSSLPTSLPIAGQSQQPKPRVRAINPASLMSGVPRSASLSYFSSFSLDKQNWGQLRGFSQW